MRSRWPKERQRRAKAELSMLPVIAKYLIVCSEYWPARNILQPFSSRSTSSRGEHPRVAAEHLVIIEDNGISSWHPRQQSSCGQFLDRCQSTPKDHRHSPCFRSKEFLRIEEGKMRDRIPQERQCATSYENRVAAPP